MRRWAIGGWVLFTLLVSCGAPPPSEDVAARVCALPTEPATLTDEGGAVLLAWEFEDDPVFQSRALPTDAAYQEYRAAVIAAEADVRRPVADPPNPTTDEEARMWENEFYNHDVAQSGQVGHIEPVVCLDALLFAYQNRRVSQLTRPTEFVASVLTRNEGGSAGLAVIFGAGMELFPPRSVYGFDVVREYVGSGWRFHYAVHNHTLQTNEGRIALGNPALSTSDVQLTRALAEDPGLESARVTNGFFTYHVEASELGSLRTR